MDFTYNELYHMNEKRIRYLHRQGDISSPIAVYFLEIAHQVDQPADIYTYMYDLHRDDEISDIQFSIFEFMYTKGIVTTKQFEVMKEIQDPSFRQWLETAGLKMIKSRKHARK